MADGTDSFFERHFSIRGGGETSFLDANNLVFDAGNLMRSSFMKSYFPYSNGSRALRRVEDSLPPELRLGKWNSSEDMKAQVRARAWLESRLTPLQQVQLRHRGKYAVKGSLSSEARHQRGWSGYGGWYCVDLRSRTGHVITDMYGNTYCVRAQGYVGSKYTTYNSYDSALSITVIIRNDENTFLREARIVSTDNHVDDTIKTAMKAMESDGVKRRWYRRLIPW